MGYVKTVLVKKKEDKKMLTTGPDLPVKPIGPGGPLIASCRADTDSNKVKK